MIDVTKNVDLANACQIIAKHLGAAPDLANFNGIHSLLHEAYRTGEKEFMAKYPPAAGRIRVRSLADPIGTHFDYSEVEVVEQLEYERRVKITWLGETTTYLGVIDIFPRKS